MHEVWCLKQLLSTFRKINTNKQCKHTHTHTYTGDLRLKLILPVDHNHCKRQVLVSSSIVQSLDLFFFQRHIQYLGRCFREIWDLHHHEDLQNAQLNALELLRGEFPMDSHIYDWDNTQVSFDTPIVCAVEVHSREGILHSLHIPRFSGETELFRCCTANKLLTKVAKLALELLLQSDLSALVPQHDFQTS